MYIELVNTKGKIKKCKVDICWPFLIFGPFVCLFRLDITSLLSISMINFLLATFVHQSAIWVLTIVGVFMYNKYYIKKLMNMGWKPKNDEAREALIENNLIVA